MGSGVGSAGPVEPDSHPSRIAAAMTETLAKRRVSCANVEGSALAVIVVETTAAPREV